MKKLVVPIVAVMLLFAGAPRANATTPCQAAALALGVSLATFCNALDEAPPLALACLAAAAIRADQAYNACPKE